MQDAPTKRGRNEYRRGAFPDSRRGNSIALRACSDMPFSEPMNLTGASQFNQARIEWAIRLRFSPMPNLSMDWVAANLNAFRIGELRVVGKIWEVMMERARELAVHAAQRASDLAGLEWQVVSDGSLEGDRHAEALTYFYKHLRTTRALD